MTKRQIRVLNIEDQYVSRCDTECLRAFEDVARTPQSARTMRGSVVLKFVPDSAKPWFAEPARRSFIRALDKRFPFFPYFLFPEPKINQLSLFLTCLLPGDATFIDGAYDLEIMPEDVYALIRRKLDTLLRFCDLVQDGASREVGAQFLRGAPNPGGILDPLMEYAEEPRKVLSVLNANLPGRFEPEHWLGTAQDLEYAQFKRAMDDDPFQGSTGDEIHVDAAVLKKLVQTSPAMARRWFNEMLETAATMPNASMAEALAGILLLVAGLLKELGDPHPMQMFEARYGRSFLGG